MPAAEDVEQPAQHQRPAPVADGDDGKVAAGVGFHAAEERAEDLRLPERDRVVQERLPDEQREPSTFAAVERIHRPGDRHEPDRLALANRNRPARLVQPRPGLPADTLLDPPD